MAKITIILFFIYFCFYVYNLCPTIPPRDSGELIAVSEMLGIAHPPGYPLYTILGRLFSLIPLGNIAYRINLSSAFFGAMTCVILYVIVRNMIYEPDISKKLEFNIKKEIYEKAKPDLIGIIASLYLAFNPMFYAESTITEVFILNSFFVVVLIYVICANIKNYIKYIIVAFIFGLGVSNQHTLVFLFPAVIFKFIYDLGYSMEKQQVKTETQKNSDKYINHNYLYFFSSRTIIFILFSFFVGISLYLYLPLRSIHNPDINWGNAGESIKNFINIITRKSYGSFKLSPEMHVNFTLNYVINQLKIFLNASVKSFGLIISFLIFINVIKLIIKIYFKKINFYQYHKFIFLLIGVVFSGPVFIIITRMPLFDYAQSMLDRFYIMYFIFIILLITLFNKNKIYVFLAVIGIILNLVFFNNKTFGMRNQFISFDFGMNIIRGIGRNSVIFIKGDSPFFLSYSLKYAFKLDNNNIFISENMPGWRVKQYVEKYFFDKSLLVYTGKEFMKKFVNIYLKKYSIFTTGIPSNTFDNINVNYCGIVNKLSLPESPGGNINLVQYAYEASFIMRGSYVPKKYQFFIKEIVEQYASVYNLLATEYTLRKEYDKAIKMIYTALRIDRKSEYIYINWGSILFHMNKFDEAKEKYNYALTINPEIADVYCNLGAIYGQEKDYETALYYFRKALFKDPNMQEVKNNIKVLENLLKK